MLFFFFPRLPIAYLEGTIQCRSCAGEDSLFTIAKPLDRGLSSEHLPDVLITRAVLLFQRHWPP